MSIQTYPLQNHYNCLKTKTEKFKASKEKQVLSNKGPPKAISGLLRRNLPGGMI